LCVYGAGRIPLLREPQRCGVPGRVHPRPVQSEGHRGKRVDAIVTPARHGPATGQGDVTAHETATPLWHQVYTGLRSAIETGRYRPESRLPSESELCRKYGVSRPVVRRAIAELRNEGLVATIKGSGAFVTDGRLEDDFV